MLAKLIWAHDGGIATSNLVDEVDEISNINQRQVANAIDDDRGKWGSEQVCGKEGMKAKNLHLYQLVVLAIYCTIELNTILHVCE